MRLHRVPTRLVLFGMVAGLICLELALRVYGFGKPLLYEVTSYGYRVKPNQHLMRFGNELSYNQQGMRSPEITAQPAPGVLRVLCIGDSITFGGVQTPQDQTYPSQIEKVLRQSGRKAEVLNASAGGWALGNELGWLEAQGTYASNVVLFEVGLNDLFQPMTPSSVVDGHPSFPSHNPLLALQEALTRYVLPRLGLIDVADPGVRPGASRADLLTTNLQTLERMVEFAREHGAHVYILSIKEPKLSDGSMPEITRAYVELQALAEKLGVRVIRSTSALTGRVQQDVFRDGIHPNSVGNQLIAKAVAQEI